MEKLNRTLAEAQANKLDTKKLKGEADNEDKVASMKMYQNLRWLSLVRK